MKTQQFVVGNAGAPIAGSTIFQADFLKNSIVHFLLVDNVPENQLNPNPDFKHNYIEGTIDRAPDVWTIGNKLIVVYSDCNSQCV